MIIGLDLLLVVFIIVLGYNIISNEYIYIISSLVVWIIYNTSISKAISIDYTFTIYKISGIELGVIFTSDYLVLILVSLLRLISLIVIIYSIYYMDMRLHRDLIIYITCFVSSMCLFVTSDNLYTLLIGYEYIGLISFLLINYYIYRLENIKSSINSILMNKMGDVFLLIGILGIQKGEYTNTLYCGEVYWMLLFISSLYKSSQIPFNNWLLLAMNAPTPISSLLHSSTLVIGGILLILKLKVYIYIDILILIYIGIFTIYNTSLLSLLETDIKRIIALSTNSQLGYLYIILSANSPNTVVFYIICHGVVKCLLFLCAGIIIHINSYLQDIRLYNNNTKYAYKNIYLLTSICILGMVGLVGVSLYYSKEELLAINISDNLYLYYYLYIGITLTMMYNIRLLAYIRC